VQSDSETQTVRLLLKTLAQHAHALLVRLDESKENLRA